MKLSLALTMMVGSAAAFTTPTFSTRSSSLNSAVAKELYTFEKSEEIFAEAKNVSKYIYTCAHTKN